MNVMTVLGKTKSLPEELKKIEKKIKDFKKLQDNIFNSEIDDNEYTSFLDNINKEIDNLEAKRKNTEAEIAFYQRRKNTIDKFFADINYDKELYIEKRFKDYSIVKIGVRHNNIPPQTIYNITKKVENELQTLIDEDIYQEWLENKNALAKSYI